MRLVQTSLHGVISCHPTRFGDERGWFSEVFNAKTFGDAGLPRHFVQDNQSRSVRGVLRGLHYQLQQPQGKLVRVLSGHIWDVALDLRRDSPTFGQHEGFHLEPQEDGGDISMLWIPPGFAHGFLVLSPSADVLYKATDFYHPASERSILWNDPDLAIQWPLEGLTPSISIKDGKGTPFSLADLP